MKARAHLLAAALALAAEPGAGRADSIVNTSHNLSVSGPGPVTATSETQVCVFCHTPHDSNPTGPLWNHQLSSGVTYVKYSSPTMVAYSSQSSAPDPNGGSKLCLSCHDGTVALGSVGSRPTLITLQGGKLQMAPGDTGYIGTDLSATHPISFVVTDQLVATNNTNNPSGLALNSVSAMRADPDVHLDALDRVQCTSCHNPHSDANYASSGVHFYNKALRSDPCVVCHVTAPTDMGGHLVAATAVQPIAPSAPATPSALMSRVTGAKLLQQVGPPPGSGGDAPAGAIAGAGGPTQAHVKATTLPIRCMSCHRNHTSGDGKRALLLGRAEDACFRCHGPSAPQEQLDGRLAAGVTPVDLMIEFEKPSHHPIEFPGDHKPNERTPETNPNARRHVLCVDCHDAHGTLARQPKRTGMSATPSPTRRFSTEAELCFLCHGAAANRPASQPDVSRQFASTSYHPVRAPGRGSRVPSLIPPLTTVSMIGCSDCHGNDNASGPVGPHGSLYAPLLVRNYQRDDLQPESPTRYDLCYRCHDRNSILSDQSFPLHRKHVVDQRSPCSACHSAHGADAPSLIAFDPNIVQPSKQGLRAFSPLGGGSGSCSLLCHGHDHEASSYCAPGVPCSTAPRAVRSSTLHTPASPIPTAESLFPGWPGQ
jgi:predicted CXXCH cytochrome family protein